MRIISVGCQLWGKDSWKTVGTYYYHAYLSVHITLLVLLYPRCLFTSPGARSWLHLLCATPQSANADRSPNFGTKTEKRFYCTGPLVNTQNCTYPSSSMALSKRGKANQKAISVYNTALCVPINSLAATLEELSRSNLEHSSVHICADELFQSDKSYTIEKENSSQHWSCGFHLIHGSILIALLSL